MTKMLDRFPLPWRVKRHDNEDGSMTYFVWSNGNEEEGPLLTFREHEFKEPGDAMSLADFIVAQANQHKSNPRGAVARGKSKAKTEAKTKKRQR